MTCAWLVQSRQITIVSCSASGRGPHSARQEVYGPKGSGKRSFAAQIAVFAAFPGGRFFAGGALVLRPELAEGVASQDHMQKCAHGFPATRDNRARGTAGGKHHTSTHPVRLTGARKQAQR